MRFLGEDLPLAEAWLATEGQLGKPLVIVLDQVEEALTHPDPARPDELGEFITALQESLGDRARRPRGKLILGLRKEWLADLDDRLSVARLPREELFLKPLDRRGVIEAVRGPGQLVDPGGHEVERPILSNRLFRHYKLVVEAGLPEAIADDLLADRDSPVAPTLQVLLNKMWEQAKKRDRAHPRFDRALYDVLRREGILLGDFLDQRLTALRQWRPETMNSGLALDLLEYHTTPLGAAAQHSAEELRRAYGHLGAELPPLVQECKDQYLLTEPVQVGDEESSATRLAHDTLAPLVRERFDSSDRPAQRARRILKNRSAEWAGGKEGMPLDKADLALVEQGASAMRALTEPERRLVEASRELETEATVRKEVERAVELLRSEQPLRGLEAMVCAVKKNRHALPNKPVGAVSAGLYKAIAVARERWSVEAHESCCIRAVAFRGDGQMIATAGDDRTVRLWNIAGIAVGDPLLGHECAVTSVAFIPRKPAIASGGWDGTIRLWSIGDRSSFDPLVGHRGPVRAVDVSKDGEILISVGDDGTLRLWSLREPGPGRVTYRHSCFLTCCAAQPCRSYCLSRRRRRPGYPRRPGRSRRGQVARPPRGLHHGRFVQPRR